MFSLAFPLKLFTMHHTENSISKDNSIPVQESSYLSYRPKRIIWNKAESEKNVGGCVLYMCLYRYHLAQYSKGSQSCPFLKVSQTEKAWFPMKAVLLWCTHDKITVHCKLSLTRFHNDLCFCHNWLYLWIFFFSSI